MLGAKVGNQFLKLTSGRYRTRDPVFTAVPCSSPRLARRAGAPSDSGAGAFPRYQSTSAEWLHFLKLVLGALLLKSAVFRVLR